jgi:hypothetical protein
MLYIIQYKEKSEFFDGEGVRSGVGEGRLLFIATHTHRRNLSSIICIHF